MSTDFDENYLMMPIIVGPKEERKKAGGSQSPLVKNHSE